MEAWRMDLEAQLKQGLEESEDEFEGEFFNGLFQQLLEDSAPLEQDIPRGSVFGRRYVYREREFGHNRLFQDYFANDCTFDDTKFRRRFRIRRSLFLQIVEKVCAFDSWFIQKTDALRRLGLFSLQKCTVALRMLAYGILGDATDEYCRVGESTAILAMKRFTIAIRGCFEATSLRQPTRADFCKQLDINAARGFPGMFGSIDCMHWTWKNRPVALQGQFQDKDGVRSIILEVIADQSLWIWHAFFGLPGGNNDISVLDRSPLVWNLLRGEGNDLTFQVNGHEYNRYYLLADGIYPPWSCFLQPIHQPQGEKREYFTKMQSAARKDVERAFGVLQARWAIDKNPCRSWDLESIDNIMIACIIMHNMVIQDEDGEDLEPVFNQALGSGGMQCELTFHELNVGTRELENMQAHYGLRNDIIDHLWQLKGESMF